MASVNISDLRKMSDLLLVHNGVPDDEVEIITESIVYAHRREKHTHGLFRIPIYIKKIQKKLMNAETRFTELKNTPVVSLFDANHGFGQVAGVRGMRICIDKAQKYGLGAVGIRNSNNFGTAGFIAEIASDKNMIGIVLGNSAPAIAPWGGKKAFMGTNPLAIAFPTDKNKGALVLDMATSVAARGKIRLAAKNGESIPDGWAFDPEGNPTNDPHKALLGSLKPIGDHKGFGLSLAIDILAGLLTGSAFGGDVKPLNSESEFSRYGHLFIAINIQFFTDFDEYLCKMDILEKNAKKHENRGCVFLAGEKSYIKFLKSHSFVSLKKDQIKEINAFALNSGVDYQIPFT